MPLFGKPKNTAKQGEITESVILEHRSSNQAAG
jgi:hypothetical protein